MMHIEWLTGWRKVNNLETFLPTIHSIAVSFKVLFSTQNFWNLHFDSMITNDLLIYAIAVKHLHGPTPEYIR